MTLAGRFAAILLVITLLLGNSQYLRATNEVTFKYTQLAAKRIEVYGSFNGWAKGYKLQKTNSDIWQQTVELQRGYYEYKFLVDGEWRYDSSLPSINDGLASKNNVIYVR